MLIFEQRGPGRLPHIESIPRMRRLSLPNVWPGPSLQADLTAVSREQSISLAPGHDGDPRTPGVLVGNPVRSAGGTNRVMLIPDGRCSHATVVGARLFVSLKRRLEVLRQQINVWQRKSQSDLFSAMSIDWCSSGCTTSSQVLSTRCGWGLRRTVSFAIALAARHASGGCVRSPRQNACTERLIGSIRGKCSTVSLCLASAIFDGCCHWQMTPMRPGGICR
jgi:hypothetical protein